MVRSIKASYKFIEAFDYVMKYYECTQEEIEEKKIWVRRNMSEAETSYFEMYRLLRA